MLLGHASRYHHGDSAITTSHPCHTFSFEERPPPHLLSKKKKTNSGLNIPECSTDLFFSGPPFFYKLGCISKQLEYIKHSKVLEWDDSLDTSELQLPF